MTDPRIDAILERSAAPRDRAEAAVARIDAEPDLKAALDAWVSGSDVDPGLSSLGYTFRQLVDEYGFSPLRAIDLLAQLRVDPDAANFLRGRIDRVLPRTPREPGDQPGSTRRSP